MRINKDEFYILQAFLHLPSNPLLDHKLELEEGYLAGFVERFLKGERFDRSFNAFTDEELETIDLLIEKNKNNSHGVELEKIRDITQITCNILNKYKT